MLIEGFQGNAWLKKRDKHKYQHCGIPMFLTRSELKELTGYARPTSQMKWLSGNKYLYEIAADGYPRVLKAFVEKRLGNYSVPEKRRNTPRFNAIA